MFVLCIAAFVGWAFAGSTTTPCHPSSSSTCTTTLCVDLINSCSQSYGGCFPACSGYTTPSFVDPGCPPTTKPVPPTTTPGDPQTSDCSSTVTETVCSPTPSSQTNTSPKCPTTITKTSCFPVDPNQPTTTPPPTSDPSTCTESICADYVNSCGISYGGCYPACTGYTTPSFTDPGCPLTTTSCSSSSSKACEFVCLDYFDECGNTYGPGCWTSCSGGAIPTFTTPLCDADATPTAYASATVE
ncbi:hypothetical protein Q7P37_010205 [Cladosporium fusiforme]